MNTTPFIIRTNEEIRALLSMGEDIENSGENDGFCDGVLATLRWLIDPADTAPELITDDLPEDGAEDDDEDAEDEDDDGIEDIPDDGFLFGSPPPAV